MRQVDLLKLMESRRAGMQVNIQTPLEIVDVNVWDELQIDEHDLNTEFMALPGQIAYWAAIAARFSRVVETAERDYENWYAAVYEEEFDKLSQATGRKPNINSVEYLVKIRHTDEFNKRKEVLEKAEADLKIIQGVVSALEAKLQALMQLAKRQVVEYNSTEVGYKGGGLPSSTTPYNPPIQKVNVGIDSARNTLRGMGKRVKTPISEGSK